jgi:hypothetical protein
MSKYVGIVYGENKNPLYCIDEGAKYFVVNGSWSFSKKTGRILRASENVQADIIHGGDSVIFLANWRVVLPVMAAMSSYNEACAEIRRAEKESTSP